jgi:diguanylate cyclase (GGDEF)-like protein
LTGTGRQSRARRPSSRKSLTSSRTDLADRIRPLQTALRRKLARADVFAQIVRAVNSSLDPERVAETMVAHAADWVPAPIWLLLAVDDAGRTRVLAGRSLTPTLDKAAQVVGHWVMRNRSTFRTANISTDRRLARLDGVESTSAAIGFPLDCRGRTIGAVVALDRSPSQREPRLTDDTQAAVVRALEPGAIALDNALRVQRVEGLSVTDDLTQLYNSRYLSQVLHRESKRATRSGRPLSLLFIDLDGFKTVNDTHGHLFGSRALVEAASVIRASARETDVVSRFGGDEFALVLPDTGADGAVAVGERIRERIAAHRFLQSEGLSIALTVSVGVATLPDISVSAEGLIQAADDAMYWVKDRGKNGIHVAGTEALKFER